MKTHIGLAALLAGLSSAALAQNFNDPAEFERQKALLTVAPQGPEGKPWSRTSAARRSTPPGTRSPAPTNSASPMPA